MDVVGGESKDAVKVSENEVKVRTITIEVISGPQGIDCRLSADSILPPNEIYIRGIFDKAKDHALGCLMMEKHKESLKKPKILLPGAGNPMGNNLKSFGKKILGR